MDISVRWLTGALLAGLLLGTAGLALFEDFLGRHRMCTAPYGAAITIEHPAPVLSGCSLTNSLYYLGIGAFILGGVLSFGATAIKLRRR